jgi:hypothetical protein
MATTGLHRVFLKRWYVALIGLLITAGLCAAALIKVPTQYETRSVTLLVPAPTKLAENPLTNLSSLGGLNDVVGTALTQPTMTANVKKAGYVGTYTVSPDVSSSGPLVVVDAISPTPAQSQSLAKKVTKLIPAALDTLQKGAGVTTTSAFVKSTIINHADHTTSVTKNRTRALIAAVAVGLVLTVLLVIGSERWSARRRRKSDPPTEILPTRGGPRPNIGPMPRRPAPLIEGDWAARAKVDREPSSIAANGTNGTGPRRWPRHSLPAPR